MSIDLAVVFVCALLALFYGGVSILWVMKQPTGTARMGEIAHAIQEGAQAYLNRQYRKIDRHTMAPLG